MLCVNAAVCETICIEPIGGAYIYAVGICVSAKLFDQFCGASRLILVGVSLQLTTTYSTGKFFKIQIRLFHLTFFDH